MLSDLLFTMQCNCLFFFLIIVYDELSFGLKIRISCAKTYAIGKSSFLLFELQKHMKLI